MLRYRSALAVSVVAVLACGCGTVQLDATATAQLSATATTPTPTATSATGGATATPGTATATPVALTDTGYKAPDGSPLYKECIQATPPPPLPPEYPTPTGPFEYPPTPTVLNLGPTPDPKDLPPFDPASLDSAPTVGWATYASKCFGFSVMYPADWILVSPFGPAGYQQGEDGVMVSPNRSAKIEVHLRISEVDELKLAMANGGRRDVFILEGPTATTFKGRPAVRSYAYVPEPPPNTVVVYTVDLGGSRYMTLSARFVSPYDVATARDALTILDGVAIP